MRCPRTPVRTAGILKKKKNQVSMGEGLAERECCALLVGTPTGAGATESSVEGPQQLKTEIPYLLFVLNKNCFSTGPCTESLLQSSHEMEEGPPRVYV